MITVCFDHSRSYLGIPITFDNYFMKCDLQSTPAEYKWHLLNKTKLFYTLIY